MTVKATKSGAVEFLTKPFRAQDLLEAIHQASDRDRMARQQCNRGTNTSGLRTRRTRDTGKTSEIHAGAHVRAACDLELFARLDRDRRCHPGNLNRIPAPNFVSKCGLQRR
jgi:FixJ family two-component response regulator